MRYVHGVTVTLGFPSPARISIYSVGERPLYVIRNISTHRFGILLWPDAKD